MPRPMPRLMPRPMPLARLLSALALLSALVLLAATVATPVLAQDLDLIFKKLTAFKLLTPDHKLAVYAVDDPLVEGVACHITLPEKGGVSGALGLAEEVSDASLACRQVGPVVFKETFEQGDRMMRASRSFFFKEVQIARGCDTTRNVLVYLAYTDKLIDGSPKNSTSTVPIMPWGDTPAPRCSEALDD